MFRFPQVLLPRRNTCGLGSRRFRSPLLTASISLSFPPLTEMFHFSGSRVHNPMCSGYVNSPCRLLGYPIRIPPDLRSLATPRGFSQLAASFFAGRLQGIPHKPFLRSLTLRRGLPLPRVSSLSPPCALLLGKKLSFQKVPYSSQALSLFP